MQQLKQIVGDRQAGAAELLGRVFDLLARQPELLSPRRRAAALRILREGRPLMPAFAVLADRLEETLGRGLPAAKAVEKLRRTWRESEQRVGRRFAREAELRSLSSVATISWSSTVRHAVSASRIVRVLVLESQPGGEGIRTARWFNRRPGMRAEVVPDGRLSQAVEAAQAVVMGADAVFPGRGIINKVGSRDLAALACKAGKPVYVLASTWKYTARRPPEVLSGESEGVFEFVPLAVVSRLITESPGGRRS